ncbi:MAG: hypothetical protein OXC80_02120 [Gammaproteobacteria bacterium]|nr:hypothetical protein [Gammaproteobacteria bacterium]
MAVLHEGIADSPSVHGCSPHNESSSWRGAWLIVASAPHPTCRASTRP